MVRLMSLRNEVISEFLTPISLSKDGEGVPIPLLQIPRRGRAWGIAGGTGT